MAIIQAIVALAFLMAGGMKAMQPKEKLRENMGWVDDYSDQQVKMLGGAEVLGGLALILSAWTTSQLLLLLGGVAALCLAVLMGGAVYTHLKRNETMMMIPGAVLGILSIIIAFSLLI